MPFHKHVFKINVAKVAFTELCSVLLSSYVLLNTTLQTGRVAFFFCKYDLKTEVQLGLGNSFVVKDVLPLLTLSR